MLHILLVYVYWQHQYKKVLRKQARLTQSQANNYILHYNATLVLFTFAFRSIAVVIRST